MRGLIIKDLLTIKSTWKNLVILFIGTLLISIALGNYLLVICALPLMILSTGMNTFQTDEFYNTESYTLSMPLSRTKIVSARYLYTLVTLVISTYIGLLIYYLIYFILNPAEAALNTDMIKYLLMLEACSLLVDSIFYPVIYKYGCEKSRIVLMSIVMFVLGIVSILSVYLNKFINDLSILEAILNYIETNGVLILSIMVVVLYLFSYFISTIIIKRKDY